MTADPPTDLARLRLRHRREPMEAKMAQKIEALSDDDATHLERQRTWVRNHYDADARHHYQTVEGKLGLLDTIVRSDWIEPSETWKLQSLGITFGDALAQKMACPG